jgi:hypothetical protein
MDQQPTPLMHLSALIGGSSAAVERAPHRTGRPIAPVPVEPSFRIGELERNAACDALADHFAAGRLDPAELDDRLARAVAARTQADLQVLFRDLRPRRSVPDTSAGAPAGAHPGDGATVPARRDENGSIAVLASVLTLCLLLAGGMLLVLGFYNPALFLAALVGGTAAAVGGGCANALRRAARRSH